MIHPSYTDLMEVVNSEVEPGEQPVVNSRYSIVLATAKRARQIIAGDEPLIRNAEGKKPLSIAVQELYEGKIKIMGEDEEADDEIMLSEDPFDEEAPDEEAVYDEDGEYDADSEDAAEEADYDADMEEIADAEVEETDAADMTADGEEVDEADEITDGETENELPEE